jgi:hypothetical protein
MTNIADETDEARNGGSVLNDRVRPLTRPKHYLVTNYWLDYYCDSQCTLCGNFGYIDTRGVSTPAGKAVGRINYCICPNGQILRANGVALPN